MRHGKFVWRPETPRERLERQLYEIVRESVANLDDAVRVICGRHKENSRTPPTASTDKK